MFSFAKRMGASSTGGDGTSEAVSLEERFNGIFQELASDLDGRFAAAVAVAGQWFAFLQDYPAEGSFENAPSLKQRTYVRNLIAKATKCAADYREGRGPPGAAKGFANGTMLVSLYLMALAGRHKRLVDRMVDVLEPLERLGREIIAGEERIQL